MNDRLSRRFSLTFACGYATQRSQGSPMSVAGMGMSLTCSHAYATGVPLSVSRTRSLSTLMNVLMLALRCIQGCTACAAVVL